jgi:streptomycin 6-kinase
MTALDHYLKLWRLEPEGEPLSTATSTIIFARRDETPCALKIAHGRSDEATASALAHFQGRGSVALLAQDGAAVLMQRANPGTPLSSIVLHGSDDEATRIVCRTMRALHSSGEPKKAFPTVEDWGTAFARPAAQSLPRPLIDDASAVYAELCRTQTRRVLLHGDLHHDNILFDAENGWLAIDPKGVVGEAEYEAGCALRNPGDEPALFAAPGIVDRRVRIICEMMSWNRERVLRWCFAQGVLSAIWSIEDGENPRRGLAIADAVRPML